MRKLREILEGLFDMDADSDMEDAELPNIVNRLFRKLYQCFKNGRNIEASQYKNICSQLNILTKHGEIKNITRPVLNRYACILHDPVYNKWLIMTKGKYWNDFHGFDIWPDAALPNEVWHIRYGFVHEKTIDANDLTHWKVNYKCYTFPQELFEERLKIQNLR